MKKSVDLVSKVGIGSVQFGLDYGISNHFGKTDKREVKNILSIAQKHRISFVDTAAAYGNSELVLGESMEDRNWHIISKFSVKKSQELASSLEQSLFRLQSDCLYGYLAHNAQLLIEDEKLWDQLLYLKSIGKIEKIGYSIYTVQELDALMNKNFIPDLIQVPYSIADQRFSEYFKHLKEINIEIHTRSVFLQGLLLMEKEQVGYFFESMKPLLALLSNRFRNSCERAGFLLLYCLQNEFVDKVIIGVNFGKQLQENIDYIYNNFNKSTTIDFDMSVIGEEVLLPYKWPQK